VVLGARDTGNKIHNPAFKPWLKAIPDFL